MVRRPLCFVLAALISGVYIRYLIGCSPLAGCLTCAFLPAFLAALTGEDKENGRRIRMAACAAAAAGMLLLQTAVWQEAESPYADLDGQAVQLQGVIVDSEDLYRAEAQSGEAAYAGSRMVIRTDDGARVLAYWRGAKQGEVLEGRRFSGAGTVELPSPARNPGGFDESLYLKGQRIFAKVQLKTGAAGDVCSGWRHFFADRRQQFLLSLDSYVDDEEAALLKAMLFGDKSSLPDELYTSFQRNGTAHVLAVSGLHVGMLYALYRWLFGRRQTLAGTAVLGCLLFSYAALAGFSASVVRASVMIAVHTAGRLQHARYDMLTGTLLSAVLILAASPYQLFSAGFQLSFLAVLLLAFVQPVCEKRLLPDLLARCRKRGTGQRAAGALQVLGAWLLPVFCMQAGMIPLTMYLFQYVSFGSFAANLPLVFLAGLVVPAGILLMGLLSLPAGGIFLPLGASFLSRVLSLLKDCNSLTYMQGALSRDAVSWPLPVLCLFYAALFFLLSEYAAVLLIRRKKRRLAAVCALILSAVLCAAAGFASGFAAADVVFVDVGQGDCVHIRGEKHVDILIDGGGRENYDVGGRIVKPYLLKNGVRTVDIALVTHLDTDHFAGIVSLCRCGMVKQLVIYEGHEPELESLIERTGLSRERITFAGAGDTIRAGSVCLDILGPLHPDESENEQSLVIAVSLGDRRVLLTGDIGAPTEQELAAFYTGRALACDILQVPHHGSRYSSTAALIEAVQPAAAVIQVGRNNYGHPAPETLARYSDAGVPVYRCDQQGAVGIDLDTMKTVQMIRTP